MRQTKVKNTATPLEVRQYSKRKVEYGDILSLRFNEHDEVDYYMVAQTGVFEFSLICFGAVWENGRAEGFNRFNDEFLLTHDNTVQDILDYMNEASSHVLVGYYPRGTTKINYNISDWSDSDEQQ